MKKYRILAVLCILCMLLSGCFPRWRGKRPDDQPGTVWVSEDATVVLKPEKNKPVTGYFIIDGQIIEIVFSALGPNIWIYSKQAIEDGNNGIEEEYKYEVWYAEFKRKDHFTVTVEETTFFEVGQQFTIYRLG